MVRIICQFLPHSSMAKSILDHEDNYCPNVGLLLRG